MLPLLMYNTMDQPSNSVNNTANASCNNIYEENVILNSVRTRKKVQDLPNCPVCSCTIRHCELESHLSLELERLQKLSSGGTKRKISTNSCSNLAVPGASTSTDLTEEQEVDVSGCTGSEEYQRIRNNRLRRLRACRRTSPIPSQGECPVCNATLPTSKLQKHALRCLKRTGADIDDVDDTSSEEGSIDVENDSPGAGGSFGAEYQWCGEWRVRAAALQHPNALGSLGTPTRRASTDTHLVVDGDEDTELYGPPQYSPSRIAPDTEQSNTTQQSETTDQTVHNTNGESETEHKPDVDKIEAESKVNGLVEASAETRIQALKAKIRELESKQNAAAEAKCLICLGPHTSPAVSIQCWHVYCEVCWLESLKAKKICPQCNAITTTAHLRRIYM